MTLAQIILVAFAGLALAFVLAFAGVVYAWLTFAQRHDPHAAPYGDIPFIPSAGVARPDAGGRARSPEPPRPPAASSAVQP